ncbi:MAG: UDP-2,4-diacetamido-2,4,6-trideoxy-beta-L-altropyranose hydrolase [Lachnospiraceae bacterium]
MFYIRADGNEKIGMGHIMRCLTIADAIKAEGEEVCFLVADEKPVKVIEDRGFQTKILFTYYDEMDVELPQLVLQLSGDSYGSYGSYGNATGGDATSGGSSGGCTKPRILIDSYYVTRFYLQNLRLVAQVYLMDDLKTEIYPCDGLVNYNIYGKTLGYEEAYPSGTKLFLGCEYMPLRPQFSKVDYQVREQVQDILLTTGGGDSCHMALSFMKEVMQKENLQKWTWHVVCGPYCSDTEELEKLAGECSFLVIHKNVTDLSELMSRCDIGISAAGSTLYELCAVGLPSIGFYFAENQKQNMETFGKTTPIMNAGDFSMQPDQVMEFIEKEVRILVESFELREKISMVMKTIVDGKGAERLAKGLLGD